MASRTLEKAEAFAEQWGAERAYDSYEAMLGDPSIDVVYIPTPHPLHAVWAIRAAEAGKHILCEKPVGINQAEAMAIFEAAEVNGVFAKEAFMYRCYPTTVKLVELVTEGRIGDVRLIEAAFSFDTGWKPEGRLLKHELGGGGILDVGCYPASAARLLAGAALGKPFVEPLEVKATGHLGETGVDEWTSASLRFPGGIVAHCLTGIRLKYPNTVRVHGSEGVLLLKDPWFGQSAVEVHRSGESEVDVVETELGSYVYEVDAVARGAAERMGLDTSGLPPMPATWMTPEDSIGNMRTLDRWRASIGLTYEMEKPGKVKPVHGGEVSVPDGSASTEIPRTRVDGLGKPVSRLVMGVDNQPDLPYLAVMLDDFVARGGNVVDTAFIYGGGRQEVLLGDYLESRPGLRENMVIITKGSHTPYCYPDVVEAQLNQSLNRLRLDSVDIYMMHRDNPEIPVERFVEAMNAEKRRGRVKLFGVSNWTLERIQEFNTCAEEKGLDKIGVISNNFSLAEMIDPVWRGCMAASLPEFKAWLEETQTLLMPWSSQARGFFTDRSAPGKTDDAELVRCWYSEDNFERKRRAEQLGGRLGVSALNINLAYVLAQKFPICPLVGPRILKETRTLLPGVCLELSPEAVAWLNLESDAEPPELG